MKTIYLALIVGVFLIGCTTVQQINKLDAGKVSNVCIVEHKDVRETVLETIKEGLLTRHGVKYRVIPGSYVIKDNRWIPTFQNEQVLDCDAVLFYVADWRWDITMYMNFASIWMTTPDSKKLLGNARYDARSSLNKYINAHDKLIELIDGIFNEYKNANPSVGGQPGQVNSVANTTAPAAVAPAVEKTNNNVPVNPTSSPASQKLRELQNLRKDGVITEDEYQLKKKQLLDQM